MAKYDEDQLKRMAQRVLQARREGDERYFQFVLSMCLFTGLTAVEVENKIEQMAEG